MDVIRFGDATVFSKNRERLVAAEVSELLLSVVEEARTEGLLSEEHFTVDGTLIQAWASRRNFSRKSPSLLIAARVREAEAAAGHARIEHGPGGAAVSEEQFGAAVPSYLGHVITENRNGLIVTAMATQAGNAAERLAALEMVKRLKRRGRITLGADKSYQEEGFVRAARPQ